MDQNMDGGISENPDLSVDNSIVQVLFKNLVHGDGYVETAPMRFYFEQPDPMDPGSRVFTRIEAVGDTADTGKLSEGTLLLARISPMLLKLPDDDSRYSGSEGSISIPAGMLHTIPPDLEQDLTHEPILRFARIPGRACGNGQAVLPQTFLWLVEDEHGNPSWSDDDFIDGWGGIPETGDTAEENEARKVTVFMEYRLHGWRPGWDN